MEITTELIDSLSAEQIELITEYATLVKEAREAVKIIRKCCKFGIQEKRICVFDDTNNKEYLSFDGMWSARYLHQSYDVHVDVNSIFDVYKAAYDERKHPSNKRNDKADSARYFGAFVRRCMKEADK